MKIKKHKKAVRPRKPLDMREGQPATNAFNTSMMQILNPLPKKKRTH